MSKKIIRFIPFLLILLLLISPVIYADDINEQLENSELVQNEILETSVNSENIPDINSRAAVVIDRDSKTILFGKDETQKRKMASTTKIMTCILAIENCKLNTIVKISKKSAGTGGSRLGLKVNDSINLKDLLYGLMLCSGNDAAVAISEHVSGSVENFALLMNKKANELGLKNTNFESPHGLDSENHYTTAYELALLTDYALKNETFQKIVSTKSYTVTINGNPKNITNTNELLGNLNGVYGVKTGFTNGANRCLVTACKRDNFDIICVVLGADTKNFRTKDSIKIIEYVFKTYKLVNIKDIINKKFKNWEEENLKFFSVIKGKTNDISLKLENLENEIIPINNNYINSIQVLISCNTTLDAPIYNNIPIGTLKIFVDSKEICCLKILTNCDINKKDILYYFKELLGDISKINFIEYI